MPINGTESILAILVETKLRDAGLNPIDPQALQAWTAIAEGIVEYLANYAELQITVPIATFSQGAGLAAIPNPAPVPLFGKPIFVGGNPVLDLGGIL